MNTITKDQWKELEEKMTHGYVYTKFKYKGYELSIQRVRTAENKTALAVYIDGVINQGWGWKDREVEGKPTIVDDVWKTRTMAKFSTKNIKAIEKIYGKRRAKQEYPDLHDRREWLEPFFPKASVLCRQFKKLEGLELVEDSGFIEGGV
ncbi:TPA: hypothetical protein ACF3XT_002282 [Vibrio parahaemolyticus]|uniref:hypothetical protein n=1 Tax=Vibrio parahaemolyticus TaxID=670 RepID=UPI00146B9C6F|nr:hypothetical protein [Vibrio parahaemolyticus]MDF5698390.1 hypothetical protein [Vibrio parahaemolyticus]MDG2765943.1 hypothetical protein [Vibrio parahaemolyticus]NMU37905.1 hypothetical protein [Vibrio parahaemolyticus]